MTRSFARRAVTLGLSLALALALTTSSHERARAFAATFAGTVVDATTGAPVPFARVVVNRTDRGDALADGTFEVSANRASSEDVIIASSPGYVNLLFTIPSGGPVEGLRVALTPLPAAAATFAPPAPSECASCHGGHLDGWDGAGGYAISAHARSATNPRVLDAFDGTASGRTTMESCAEVGGSFEEIGDPTGARVHRCFVGVGMLADLNPQCGHAGQPRCSDASAPASARPTVLGDCAGCHTPGDAIALPEELDLDVSAMRPDTSSVTCAGCHRISEVLDPNLPGVLVGAVVSRASEVGASAIAFGPRDDAASDQMMAVFSPLFASSRMCAPCHQDTYAAPGARLDRFPAGVPSEQTYEEWSESFYASGARKQTCQDCHMPSLAALGIGTSAPLIGFGGPRRRPEDLHAHNFDPLTSPDALARTLDLMVEGRADGDHVVVDVNIANIGVGHAFPSGVTSRNAIVHVTATLDGTPLVATSGDALPPWAGERAAGSIVAISGQTITVDAELPSGVDGLELRVYRETERLRDYTGFGSMRAMSRQDKGLRALDAAWTYRVVSASGRELVVRPESDGPVGDLVGARFVLGDASYLGGAPGLGLAKVTVAADGRPNVPFWLASDIVSDNRLAPGETQSSTHRFRVPDGRGGEVVVRAELIYRPAFIGTMHERGWGIRDTRADAAEARVRTSGSSDAGPTPADAGVGTAPPDDGGCSVAGATSHAGLGAIAAAVLLVCARRSRARRRRAAGA